MGPGKIASQAGHAYVGAILQAQKLTPDVAQAYTVEFPGTKVCLAVPSLDALLRAHRAAHMANLPCALITDSGCANFFDGQPTITALGIGPAMKHQVKHITGRFKLL